MKRALFLVTSLVFLDACSSDTTGPNRPPVAVAGPDQVLPVRQAADLDGVASFDPDGGELTFAWSVVSAPEGGTSVIAGEGQMQATITPNTVGVWVIRLTVTDVHEAADSDVIELRTRLSGCTNDSDCNDGIVCTADSCNTVTGECVFTPDDELCLDDGLYCSGAEICDAQKDCVSSGDPCFVNELVCDEDKDECTICHLDTDCDDGNPCTDEHCDQVSGACTHKQRVGDCDDGNLCTLADACEGGNCIGQQKTGVLEGNGGCDDGNVCTNDSCLLADGSCQHVNNAAACDDSIACTGSDSCLGGSCSGEPDDSFCGNIVSGSVCRPGCGADGDGCVQPVETFDLQCDGPVDLSGDNSSVCSLTLTGAGKSGQADCLRCTAEIGATVVDFTDFEDLNRDCSLDGWAAAPHTGRRCTSDINDCSPGGGDEECADDNLCDDGTFLNPVLRADKAQLSGGHNEQVRISKTVDASGLSDLWICFDYAEEDADNEDGLLLYVSDGDHPIDWAAPFFCKNNGPRGAVDDWFYRYCLELPAWTADESALSFTFVPHSNTDDQQVFLDNIEIFGWGGGCASQSQNVFQDNFDGCDLSNWNVTEGTPVCPGDDQCSGSGNLQVENDSWTVEAGGIDASDLDERVTLCFTVGDYDANSAGDFIDVDFFDGRDWLDAWHLDGDLGSNGDCFEVCVNLSAIYPAVNNNPNLGIRIAAGSDDDGDKIMLDDVVLKGLSRRPAACGVLELSQPVEGSPGEYQFMLTDSNSSQLTAVVECSLDAQPDKRGSDAVWFMP
ncbi:MAG TPA: Ig-like domain-containing protein [Myxococcota bacterium]|nr:Ig-like domain-containing protein [Myxococcota bacterium]